MIKVVLGWNVLVPDLEMIGSGFSMGWVEFRSGWIQVGLGFRFGAISLPRKANTNNESIDRLSSKSLIYRMLSITSSSSS